MPQAHTLDLTVVEHWLVTAQITSCHQWDMLVFLYRHPNSLASADHLARLLGYATSEVVVALDALEALGFVVRSRASQGVRLYQFSASGATPPGAACQQLMGVADSRAVRLLLAQRWRREARTLGTKQRYGSGPDHAGGAAWRRAS